MKYKLTEEADEATKGWKNIGKCKYKTLYASRAA
jgi:hypothetical protein